MNRNQQIHGFLVSANVARPNEEIDVFCSHPNIYFIRDGWLLTDCQARTT
jgi:hypothetical protein